MAVALGYEFLGENASGRGDWEDVLAFAAKDAEQGRKAGALARIAWSEFCRVQGLHAKGELAGGSAAVIAALELCEQIGEERLATWLDPMAAVIAVDLGDDDTARFHAERGWRRAAELNQVVLSSWALNALGYAAMQRGDVGEAVEWYDRYVALIRGTENRVAQNVVLARAAEAFFRAGRIDDASRPSRSRSSAA